MLLRGQPGFARHLTRALRVCSASGDCLAKALIAQVLSTAGYQVRHISNYGKL